MADTKPDYSVDIQKYVTKVDADAVKGIVKYCGIALRSKDSSLVSVSDKVELERVRNNFLKRKLGLKGTDAELDAAIKGVAAKMKGVREKSRVTFYYLLAEATGTLGNFAPKA